MARFTVAASPAQKEQFDTEGYCVLEHVLQPSDLEMLRQECQTLMDESDRSMAAKGETVRNINHKGKRYFISKRHTERPRLREFLFGETMAEVCRSLVGGDVWLFNEQFVIKSAEVGMAFAWHQDSGYIDRACPHKPYLSLWCALDDVDEDNGTVHVLPFSRAETSSRVEHRVEPHTNDLVGYRGPDPGEGIVIPAGGIAAFTSVSFHRSGANRTNQLRRVFLAQYSVEPIIDPRTKLNWALAVPFLKDGRRIPA